MVATKTAAQHSQQQTANAEFLMYAASVPRPTLTGSIASGSAGGGNSPVVWSRQLPVVPRWIDAVELDVTLPYTLTIPAGATVYVSPYAPWSALQNRLTIAGSPPWDYVSLVPFWIDQITRRQNFDPSIGLPDTSTATFADTFLAGLPPAQVQKGTWQFTMGNADLEPGQSINNAGTTAETVTGTISFTATIQLQRRRNQMFGTIPNGDPQDRPDLEMQLSNLVGPQPENSLIQDPNASGATMVLSSAGTVNATYHSKGLDVMPAGVAPATPVVGLGWSINSFQTSVQNNGQIVPVAHTTAMLYQKIIHLLVNNQKSVEADYFGLWVTGEQQNARWEYDAVGLSNFPSYYKRNLDVYGRFLPSGLFLADLVGGDEPQNPSATPYVGVMSPDESYATAFGIAFTPAMTTALRVPSGTSMNGAYIRTYTLGMVEVPY
jgi:hypothetical protein